MIRHFVNNAEPKVILTINYSEKYWWDYYKEPGYLDKFHQEHTELFDQRYFSSATGNRKVLILENDHVVTNDVMNLAKKVAGKWEIKEATSICAESLTDLIKKDFEPHTDAIHYPAPHNICIDSLFQNRKQFAWLVNNFLLKVHKQPRLNFFILSRGSLLEVLNEEVTKDVYGPPIGVHRNNLVLLDRLSRIYDVVGDYATHIAYDSTENKFVAKRKYLWNFDDCKYKKEDDKPKKDKWE